jgi:hypothetical protein
METTWSVTEADRDERGSIKLNSAAPAEPRSLADLLPSPAAMRAGAARITTRSPSREEIGALAIVALAALFMLFYSSLTPTAAPRPQLDRATIMPPTIAPALPTAPPVALLPAYAAPDGVLLGMIEETRQITPVAHYGESWLQADVSGSGRIWLRAADLPGVALIGADLAPKPTAAPVSTEASIEPAIELNAATPAPMAAHVDKPTTAPETAAEKWDTNEAIPNDSADFAAIMVVPEPQPEVDVKQHLTAPAPMPSRGALGNG